MNDDADAHRCTKRTLSVAHASVVTTSERRLTSSGWRESQFLVAATTRPRSSTHPYVESTLSTYPSRKFWKK